MKPILYFTLGLILISSCNKIKHRSNRLMKGEEWEVKEVSVDQENLQLYGEWKITSDVDIYDSIPSAEWINGTDDAVFEWQFQSKGKEIQLNYKQLCAECNGSDLDTLDYFTYHLSGNYDVEKHGRNHMIFESNSTIGYSGKKVHIEIQRKK